MGENVGHIHKKGQKVKSICERREQFSKEKRMFNRKVIEEIEKYCQEKSDNVHGKLSGNGRYT